MKGLAALAGLAAVVAVAGFSGAGERPEDAPAFEGGVYSTRDGARLPVTTWEPRGSDAQGAVIALHSFGDFRLAFSELGPRLAAAGFRVHAFDQRGFGETMADGRWAGEERLVSDALDFYGLIRESGNAPVYLLGESMGGSIALLVAARQVDDPPDGLVLAAPGVREGIPFRRGWDVLLWLGERLAPALSISLSRDYTGQLHRAAVERFRDDPRVMRRVRLDTYAGLVRLADDATEVAGQVGSPVLLLYGDADGMVRPEAICGLHQGLAGPSRLEVTSRDPHLVLQTPDHPLKAALIVEWLAGGPNARNSNRGAASGCPGVR